MFLFFYGSSVLQHLLSRKNAQFSQYSIASMRQQLSTEKHTQVRPLSLFLIF